MQSNKSIFLRSIDHPALSTQYVGHTAQTTVARFAPSGYYVASGDESGLVRVWDCKGEGVTKGLRRLTLPPPSNTTLTARAGGAAGEYHVFSGPVYDVAWDGDSQRIIAVGNGRQRFGHCFTADSGNTVGEISGHSAAVNAVAIRQQRPLRAATASDDGTIAFHHGAPFKFNTSLTGNHSNFVYVVAFSPDGTSLMSAGADKKIWLYDGRSGEVKGQLGVGEHKGSIFAAAWASDSTRFVTASADQTVKVWDVEANRVLQSWTVGEDSPSRLPHHQVGVVWPAGRSDGRIVSLDLNGDLTSLVVGTQTPVQVVRGHQKSITALTASHDPAGRGETLWTGSYDGRIRGWDVHAGSAMDVQGDGHASQIVGFAESPPTEGKIYSVSWDDTLRSIDISTRAFTDAVTKLTGQPRKVVRLEESTVAVITSESLQLYAEGTGRICEMPQKATPLSLAASTHQKGAAMIAVGGEDQILRLYSWQSGSSSMKLEKELTGSTSSITSLAFCPNQKYLAAGSSSGKILVYDLNTYNVVTDRWSGHTGRVDSIAWNHDSTYAASGGLDTHLFVWSVASPGKRIKTVQAHKDGVNGVVWAADGKRVYSVGGDAAVKVWKFDA